MAQRYTDMCIWAHGFPEVNISPFDPQGQNLWVVGPSRPNRRPNVENPMQAWRNEVRYYNYETNECQVDKKCGHYTQVNIMFIMCDLNAINRRNWDLYWRYIIVILILSLLVLLSSFLTSVELVSDSTHVDARSNATRSTSGMGFMFLSNKCHFIFLK